MTSWPLAWARCFGFALLRLSSWLLQRLLWKPATPIKTPLPSNVSASNWDASTPAFSNYNARYLVRIESLQNQHCALIHDPRYAITWRACFYRADDCNAYLRELATGTAKTWPGSIWPSSERAGFQPLRPGHSGPGHCR